MTWKESKALKLEQFVYAWRILLNRFALNGELLKASKQAFSLDEIPHALNEINTAIKSRSWQLFPSIKLISKKRIGAARAAWSDSEKVIYINENWFKTAGNNELISVLTEEFGHFLDNSVNSFDTYGDEGYAFSQILLSDFEHLESNYLSSLNNEYITITLNNGNTIKAEPSNFTGGGGDDTISGTSSSDYIDGKDGNDVINGEDGDDTLLGGAGNDTINGGRGNDLKIYNGNYDNYTITEIYYGIYSVTDNVGNNGIDTIKNVEKLQFSNQDFTINRFVEDDNNDGLVDDAAYYHLFNNSFPIPLKTAGGKSLSDSTHASWDVVNAVQDGSGFKILLKGTAAKQGKFQIRNANSEGVITTYSKWEMTSSALQLGWESTFNDINNDGIIGFPIIDADSDGLVDDANSYQIYDSGSSIDLTTPQGRSISGLSSPDWNITKVIADGSDWKVLFKGENGFDGMYKAWTADTTGKLHKGVFWSEWKSSRWMLEHGYSELFNLGLPPTELIELDIIQGTSVSDYYGGKVSLSSDGNRLAVSSRFSSNNGERSGQVSIYSWNELLSNWQLLGSPIVGESTGHQAGYSTAISANGERIAISSPFNNLNSNSSSFRRGQIRTYEWNGSSWTKTGEIYGQSKDDRAGYAIEYADNGNILAIGATANHNSNGRYSGNVRIFKWDNNSWQQMGTNIKGEAAGDFSGGAISLSKDGLTVAIGAYMNDGKGYSNAQPGHVRVYKFNGSSWVQTGQDIDGEKYGDFSGAYVDLSSDGQLLAISALINDGKGQNSGHVRVYKWDSSSDNWIQYGSDIDGFAADDYFGYSPKFLDDGNKLIVGAADSSVSNSSGSIRIYEWNGVDWSQLLGNINGIDEGDKFGRSLDVTNDGKRITIGAPGNDIGYVKTFRLLPVYSNEVKDINNDGLRDGLITKYQVVNGGTAKDIKNSHGKILSESTSQSWDIIKAVISGSGYKVLLKGTGSKDGKYQIWDLDSNGYANGFSGWKTASIALQLDWETIFGDFNDDGIIGFPIADANGDGLVDDANKYQIFNNGAAITLISHHGKTLSNPSNFNWDIVKAVSSESGYKIILRGTGNKDGKYQIRDTNSDGITTNHSKWETVDNALQLGWESIFGDLNGDEIIGFPIADANGDGLVDGTNKYQIFNNGSAISLTNHKGKTLSDSSNPNWDVIKAISSNSGYKIILRGTENKDGKYQVRDTNSNGLTTNYSKWETTYDALQLGWESIFGDINGDGFIGVNP